MLYTFDQAVRISLREERCQEKAKTDRVFAKKKTDLDLATEQERGAIRLDAATKHTALVERELDAALVWYRDPIVVASASAVVLILVEVALAFMLANASTLQVTQ